MQYNNTPVVCGILCDYAADNKPTYAYVGDLFQRKDGISASLSVHRKNDLKKTKNFYVVLKQTFVDSYGLPLSIFNTLYEQ